MSRPRSQLHLQLGQEVIYVLMTLGLVTALVLIANTYGRRQQAPPPLPDCALPGHGPCLSPRDLPTCARPGNGPCYSADELPSCMMPGRGPCLSRQDIRPQPAPPPQKPPILNLTERKGYRFATGKYDISQQFRDQLEAKIVPQILELGAEYSANVVEVVGHTDSVAIRSPTSSLDSKLVPYLSGIGGEVEAADNVGLGMMRAASVARALRESPGLRDRGFVFLAMSAGQTITPDDRPIGLEKGLVSGDESRRRVEIRLRRSLSSP